MGVKWGGRLDSSTFSVIGYVPKLGREGIG